MSDPAPAPVSAPSDSERITALETKISALITLLKDGFKPSVDGDTGSINQVFSLTNKDTLFDSL